MARKPAQQRKSAQSSILEHEPDILLAMHCCMVDQRVPEAIRKLRHQAFHLLQFLDEQLRLGFPVLPVQYCLIQCECQGVFSLIG